MWQLYWSFVSCWALWGKVGSGGLGGLVAVEAAIKERFTTSGQNPSVFTPSVPHTPAAAGCYRLRPGAANHSGPHSLTLGSFPDSEWPQSHKSAAHTHTHTASGEVRGIRVPRQAFSPSVSVSASLFVLGSVREALRGGFRTLPPTHLTKKQSLTDPLPCLLPVTMMSPYPLLPLIHPLPREPG